MGGQAQRQRAAGCKSASYCQHPHQTIRDELQGSVILLLICPITSPSPDPTIILHCIHYEIESCLVHVFESVLELLQLLVLDAAPLRLSRASEGSLRLADQHVLVEAVLCLRG